jgi:hypothetical protein
MKNFDFWAQVRIRQEQACDLAKEEFFCDITSNNPKFEGFVAKSKYSKAVKLLVAEVEMLRQLPSEFRKL